MHLANEIPDLYKSPENPNGISRERVTEEFMKLATKGKFPGSAIQYLQDTGWIKYFPQIEAIVDVPQDSEWHPEGSVSVHTAHVMNAAAEIADRRGLTGDDRAVAVAMQADGKAVVLADSDNGTSRDFVIIRLLDNGALDPKFADQGKRILKVRDNSYTERGFKPWNVKNFQIGGLFVIQSPGGSSFSGVAAWTPLYRLNEKFGIKINAGALLLKKITGENFIGVDYSLGFQWKPLRYFSFEEALGAQTWLDYGGTSFALSAQINWYMSDHLKVKKPFFQKLLDRVFFGYSLLTDAVFIHQLKLGIGVDF
jgi:hypothetical protein